MKLTSASNLFSSVTNGNLVSSMTTAAIFASNQYSNHTSMSLYKREGRLVNDQDV